LIPPPEQSKLYQTLKQGDDRRKIQQQSKLQVSLFKQKELLKKDILKKRALLEKELQIDIQNEIAANVTISTADSTTTSNNVITEVYPGNTYSSTGDSSTTR